MTSASSDRIFQPDKQDLPTSVVSHLAQALGIEQDGRLHSGIDDCRNFAKVVGVLIGRKASFVPTHRALTMLRGHSAGLRPGVW